MYTERSRPGFKSTQNRVDRSDSTVQGETVSSLVFRQENSRSFYGAADYILMNYCVML